MWKWRETIAVGKKIIPFYYTNKVKSPKMLWFRYLYFVVYTFNIQYIFKIRKLFYESRLSHIVKIESTE